MGLQVFRSRVRVVVVEVLQPGLSRILGLWAIRTRARPVPATGTGMILPGGQE
jgi:hypothetical protein